MRLLAAYHSKFDSEDINEDQEQQQSPVLPAANQAPLLQEGNSPSVGIVRFLDALASLRSLLRVTD